MILAIYFISATGTSSTGTSESAPMSLSTAMKKSYANNDSILFKRGDVFYGTALNFGSNLYIGSYGTGAKPIISGAKIIRKTNSNNLENWLPDGSENYTNAWQQGSISGETWSANSSGNIWRIDLSASGIFSGITNTTANSGYRDIGFIEDISTGEKYHTRRLNLTRLASSTIGQNLDFYCESAGKENGTYLYLRSNENPNKKKLILTTNRHLLYVSSNSVIENLHLRYTGAHGILTMFDQSYSNIIIRNCIIEDIGGSVQFTESDYNDEMDIMRYGNGIEIALWGKGNATHTISNVTIEYNIFRNIYDTAFTIQGDYGNYLDFKSNNNIYVANIYAIELWVNNVIPSKIEFLHHNNLHVNQGRGWGYDARPDKGDYENPSQSVYWGQQSDVCANREIGILEFDFQHNTYFNPARLYWISEKNLKKPAWTFANNDVYLQSGTYLRQMYDLGKKFTGSNFYSYFNSLGIEKNTSITTITQSELETIYSSRISIAMTSNDYDEIWNAFFPSTTSVISTE